MGYGVVDNGRQVGIAAQEARRKSFVDSEHILHNENLAVAAATGTDADSGNHQLTADTRRQVGGNLFEHDSETSEALEQLGVVDKLLSFGLFAGSDIIAAEFIDRLGCESEVAAHGDSGR